MERPDRRIDHVKASHEFVTINGRDDAARFERFLHGDHRCPVSSIVGEKEPEDRHATELLTAFLEHILRNSCGREGIRPTCVEGQMGNGFSGLFPR